MAVEIRKKKLMGTIQLKRVVDIDKQGAIEAFEVA